MFLLRKLHPEGKGSNPCPEAVLKTQQRQPNKEKKPSSTCNTVSHLSLQETSEAADGEPAAVKTLPRRPTSVPQEPALKLTSARGCKKWLLMGRGTKCHVREDTFRSASYVDPRVPSQKG